MSLNKQSNARGHLSNLNRSQIHLVHPITSEPDATGFSETESGPTDPTVEDQTAGTPEQNPSVESKAVRNLPPALPKSVHP